MVKEYIRKPTIIQAIQYRSNNCHECLEFLEGNGYLREYAIILSLNSYCYPGDYIIKDADGKFSSCSPKLFKQLYMEVKDLKYCPQCHNKFNGDK